MSRAILYFANFIKAFVNNKTPTLAYFRFVFIFHFLLFHFTIFHFPSWHYNLNIFTSRSLN